MLFFKTDSDEEEVRKLIAMGQKEDDEERAKEHYGRAIEMLNWGGIRRICEVELNNGYEDEITQDILMEFYKAMPRFRFKSKVGTYLHEPFQKTKGKWWKKLKKERDRSDTIQSGLRDQHETQADPMKAMMLARIYGAIAALKQSKNQRARKDGELFEAHFVFEIPLDELVKLNPWMSKNGLRKRLHGTMEEIKSELRGSENGD